MTFDISGRALYPLSDLLDLDEFPLADFLPADALQDLFEELYFTDVSVFPDGDHVVLDVQMAVERELALRPPGTDAFSLVFASGGEGWTAIHLVMVLGPEPSATLLDVTATLRISGDILQNVETQGATEIGISADVRFSADGITLENVSQGPVTLPPTLIVPLNRVIDSLALLVDLAPGKQCVAIQWTESDLAGLLRGLVPNTGERGTPIESVVTLQIVFGDPIEEIRLDWELSGLSQTLQLPGFAVTAPDRARFSLLLGAGDRPLSDIALLLTLPAGAALTASSTFAWERDGMRELHNDDARTDADPFFTLSFGLANDERLEDGVTVVLVNFDAAEAKIPAFFQQLAEPIPALDFSLPDSICHPFDLEPVPLDLDLWAVSLDVNLDEDFQFPFLGDDGPLAQFVTVTGPSLTNLTPDLEEKTIPLTFNVIVKFGDVQLATTVDVIFNWETFALRISHDAGIDLISEQPQLPANPTEHLGLVWRFEGAEITDGPNAGKYHYLTLATKNSQYQLQQATGAVFEIDFTKASKEGEPITFSVSDFALTPKGISLAAEVTDRPARLNGIDTRFRFHGSRFAIQENRIKDFTLSGSGPLPPDLVGPAMVDISLQFAQQNDKLTLVAGGAKLSKEKLLEAKNTRFQFQIDAIGLKFVNDGRFHLYFTLTGSAQFVLAPSDDRDGALALLPKIKIDLVECPLTGDTSVIAKHVQFLIELPKKLSFSFLGCFELELRGIGFIPQADVFGGDAAMLLTGQLKFAQGAGDAANASVDFHGLYIGVPAPGSFIPRINFKGLAVDISVGEAFKLQGVVDFIDGVQEKGFSGEGTLEIQGLPTIAASFAFLRVRRNETSPWVRAWFIFLEARQVSFQIPVVQLFLREIGLGFGYRYTLASIKTADRANDLKQLLGELRALSRTQGDLSKRDRWEVDLEAPGEDLRWTIVLRALISQTSASPSPLKWNPAAERDLPCVFLFDAVVAFRSDLTFFMAVRAWLNTNYHDFVTDRGMSETPVLSGFVLLSPRQKRFLAQASSNPEGRIGTHPPVPDYVNRAIQNSNFSVTLLIEPGLFHYEMGWPNMLTWSDSLGPLQIDLRGGFIFRVSETELVSGVSFLARGRLSISASFDFGIVGLRLSATAAVAYGARYIGVVDFRDPERDSAVYGGIGLELRITFSIRFWIRIELLFTTITIRFGFSLSIGFTAGLEIGLDGIPPSVGVRGSGTVSLRVMGHSLRLNVRLGINEGAVRSALRKTERFLKIGLEATDVEPVPGVGGSSSAATLPSGGGGVDDEAPATGAAVAEVTSNGPDFVTPNYHIFVVRGADGRRYFVLLPQGEAEEQNNPDEMVPERGFLPAPPADAIDYLADESYRDFELTLPPTDALEAVERYDAVEEAWVSEALSATDPSTISWKADWDATEVLQAGTVETDEAGSPTGDPDAPAPDPEYTLRRYMRHAFVTAPDPANPTERVIPVGDPQPIAEAAGALQDERVHNPTDNAFEAAVRGAVEQFRGSPFFKRDPNHSYDQALGRAFDDGTSVYTDRELPLDDTTTTDDELKEAQALEQADQLRGLVIHDLIADVREYAAASEEAERTRMAKESIAFQMGLVFRASGEDIPWLDGIPSDAADTPAIRQRLGPESVTPSDEEKLVRTFNLPSTSFAARPPQFQRVQQYTDADTIAITWDIAWEERPDDIRTRCQGDPEHHLMHYQVRRRALDGAEPTAVYTVKPAEPVYRKASDGEASVLQRIKPRFQLVDHFTEETLDDRAGLPVEGRSYLYTITPVDFAGALGRPLTLIATRRPNDPPQVPVDAELTVRYRFARDLLAPDAAAPPEDPQIVEPDRVRVTWTEPAAAGGRREVPVARYVLVFRKDPTLPIGSYGLDSTTQGPRTKSLPTSNARPIPTDIKITIQATGTRERRVADVPLSDLRAAGVLPAGEAPLWRPESWLVFIQAVSIQDVPSALAPVQLLLQAEMVPGDDADDDDLPLARREERRPAQLEWLADPALRFPLLTPEDQRALTGPAHFPMPTLDGSGRAPTFNGTLDAVSFRTHPAGIRAIRMRWNQGPSGRPGYPLDLHAGYHLFELDIDAHTTETFGDRDRLAQALRPIQEVQMLPAGDLLLTPRSTLSANQWEAWYAGTILRLRGGRPAPEGSETPFGPWYSWRESILEWPSWQGITDGAGERTEALHPMLQTIVDALAGMVDGGGPKYTVDVQIPPPMQPGDLRGFMAGTAPKADPYGWSILQRLGLSTTVALRRADTGDTVDGLEALSAIELAVNGNRDAPLSDEPDPDRVVDLLPHLHIEALFQPGRSVELTGVEQADPGALLAMVQLSLRPTVTQQWKYGVMTVAGPPGALVKLAFELRGAGPATTVIQTESAARQIQLEPSDSDPITQTFALPPSGTTNVLVRVRGADLPDITGSPVPPAEDPGDFAFGAVESFPATDERSVYFTNPTSLAADFATGGVSASQWQRFKRYLESINSNDPDVPADARITVPSDQGGIEALLPAFLPWAQRFFDASGGVTVDPTTALGAVTGGPWLATAYPRVSTPAFATPDKTGRLKYDHLLEDPWAHTYRYYIRPFGRYDLLWQSFRQSPSLFPGDEQAVGKAPEVTPDPEGGGLDVVLDRTKPVSKPLVLSAGRLDAPAVPGSPSPPGATWEVMVAQHPEQALIERNQTLFRQLGFRQVAFTMFRRFALPEWPDQLEQIVRESGGSPGYALRLAFVENHLPDGLPEYPSEPDHLDLAATLDADDALSIDIPARVGAFHQGALVLQWESIPYYYEHRLWLIAQTVGVVSPINEVTERDFSYQSPTPDASVEGVLLQSWQPVEPFRSPGDSTAIALWTREATIPLRRFWDCLSEAAQAQWVADEPPPKDATVAIAGTDRLPSSLPDPEVVYQIVAQFSGNVEVQGEVFFETTEPRSPGRRQLGQRVLVEVAGVDPPPAGRPHDDFRLRVNLLAVSEVASKRTYDEAVLATATREKIAFDGMAMSAVGVFTPDDRDNLLIDSVDELTNLPQHPRNNPGAGARSFLDEWYSAREVSTAPSLNGLPEALRDRLDYPEIPTGTDLPPVLAPRLSLDTEGIGWTGPISEEQTAALRAYHPDLPVFQEAVAELLDALSAAVFRESYVVNEDTPRPRPDADLPGSLTIEIRYAELVWVLRWTGAMTSEEREALLALDGDSAFTEAVEHIIDLVDTRVTTVADIAVGTTTSTSIAKLAIDVKRDDRADPISRTLRWTGPMDTSEADALRRQEGDQAFRDAVERLIAAVATAFEGEVFEERIEWPERLEKEDLVRLIRNPLAGLAIGDTEITWAGVDNLELDVDDLGDRVQRCLPAGHPFTAPFANLMARIQTFEPLPVEFTTPRLLRCTAPLSAEEVASLTALFPSEIDTASVNALADDQHDRHVLDGLVARWVVTEAVSRSLAPAPEDVPTVDFPEPRDCRLVWEGELTDAVRGALRALPGDEAFTEALERLATWDRPQPASTGAPIGLDQVPTLVEGQIVFGIDAGAGAYEDLTWAGSATDAQAAVLRRWARIPEFREAVDSLLEILAARETTQPLDPTRPSAADLPIDVGDQLQIGPDELAWVGAPPTDAQRDTLTGLAGDEGFTDAIGTLLDAIDEDDGASCVVAVPLPALDSRPTQDVLPAILDGQLEIRDGEIAWTGRIHSPEQRQALESLPGDPAFTGAVAALLEAIDIATETIAFTLPVRPQPEDLPDVLRDGLLIGRALARYQGLMPAAQAISLRQRAADVAAEQVDDPGDAVVEPDRRAIQRLYEASLRAGLEGTELRIRARRGTATPSDMIVIQPRALEE